MNRKPMLAIGVAAVFALAAGAAQAQTNSSGANGTAAQTQANAGKASKADQAFLKEAVQGDMTEVKMGELAQQKGQSDSVKTFGETLQKDHGDHLKKLQAMAQQMGAQAPSEPSAKQQADYDKLAKLSGAKFDREFAKHMVMDHKMDISKYQAEAKKTGPLAELAKETVPTLQKHLQMAQSLDKPAATTGAGGSGKMH
jgi:putative membrane protein